MRRTLIEGHIVEWLVPCRSCANCPPLLCALLRRELPCCAHMCAHAAGFRRGWCVCHLLCSILPVFSSRNPQLLYEVCVCDHPTQPQSLAWLLCPVRTDAWCLRTPLPHRPPPSPPPRCFVCTCGGHSMQLRAPASSCPWSGLDRPVCGFVVRVLVVKTSGCLCVLMLSFAACVCACAFPGGLLPVGAVSGRGSVHHH
jgi:hypothetical protein